MVGDILQSRFGAELDGSTGQVEVDNAKGERLFAELVGGDIDPTAPYAYQSYDAAAVLLLAMQAAGSTEPDVYKDYIDDVANEGGTKIFAGQLSKGLRILKDGGKIDYVGASGVEFSDSGDSIGDFQSVSFLNGQLQTGDFIL